MIVELRLENWKSYENASLYVDALSVLVGTNASGKSNAPPARAISSASRAPGPLQGAWRLIINSDLAISRPSEADQSISRLNRIM